MPSLGTIRGDLTLITSAGAECSQIPSSLVRGQYHCEADNGTANKHNGLSKGVIAGIAVGTIMGIGIVGVALWCLIRRRRQRARQTRISVQERSMSKDEPRNQELDPAAALVEAPVQKIEIAMLESNGGLSEAPADGGSHGVINPGGRGLHELPANEVAAHEVSPAV